MAKHFQIFDGEPWEYRENISKKTYTKWDKIVKNSLDSTHLQPKKKQVPPP
jgi:hypothetical protein